jgi:hypothetical protein
MGWGQGTPTSWDWDEQKSGSGVHGEGIGREPEEKGEMRERYLTAVRSDKAVRVGPTVGGGSMCNPRLSYVQ